MASSNLKGRWKNMLSRCRNPNTNRYYIYGGRGIKVCQRWHKFKNFAADMGSTYRPGLTLNRIDNDKGYSPSKCNWITPARQMRNTSSNVWVDTPAGRMCLKDAAAWGGIRWLTLRNRIVSGWPKENWFDPVTNGGDRRSSAFQSKSAS